MAWKRLADMRTPASPDSIHHLSDSGTLLTVEDISHTAHWDLFAVLALPRRAAGSLVHMEV